MPMLAAGAYWALSHLLILASLLWLVWLRARASRGGGAQRVMDRLGSGGGPLFSATVIALVAAQCALYLGLPNFNDYGEPTIPLLAGNILHGAPVYGDWQANRAIVGSNYGPYVFLSQIPALLWLPNVFGSKLLGVLCALGALLATFGAVRRRSGSTALALALTALMTALLATELNCWFWNRPDSFLLAFSAIAVLLLETARPAVCLIAVGLLAGLALNFKLFGPIYLIPVALVCVATSRSWRALLGALLAGGGLFVLAVLAPFALPSFSAPVYLANLLAMPRQGFFVLGFWQSLVYGLVILATPVLSWRTATASPQDRLLGASLVVCAIVVAIVSGKPGGGTPYMMPLIPVSLYLTARLASRQTNSPESAPRLPNHRMVLLAVLVFAAPCWAFEWWQLARHASASGVERAQAAELRSLFLAYPGSEVGHNSGPAQDEYLRAEKAFLGQTTRFDYVNVIDQMAAGQPASALHPLFERCNVPSWILSRQGGRLLGADWSGRPLFDAGSRARFYTNYELAGRYRFYEVWRCRRDTTPKRLAPPS